MHCQWILQTTTLQKGVETQLRFCSRKSLGPIWHAKISQQYNCYAVKFLYSKHKTWCSTIKNGLLLVVSLSCKDITWFLIKLFFRKKRMVHYYVAFTVHAIHHVMQFNFTTELHKENLYLPLEKEWFIIVASINIHQPIIIRKNIDQEFFFINRSIFCWQTTKTMVH